ncbi:hypothetical protein [Vreelandella salicampi]|uniref:DUF3618 domain-containing protein n=1 Tax=Vreelandella salicampi TaxID=1449798 RepID=A0A7Z0RW24_9GAMM|nr:hypothetical protein [Halomonas salicampi]NYS62227.1 hypothetical protein [Halomonas salicampi]
MTPSNLDPNRPNADSKPDDTSSGSPKQQADEAARDVKRDVGAEAREKAEAGQQQFANEADNLSEAIDAAASKLDDKDREGLARYARELSSNLATAAQQLEDRSVDELASDAKRLARDNPALYMLGSIAVGFGLSRFFKASTEHDHEGNNASPTDTDRKDDSVRNDDVSSGEPIQRRERVDMTNTYTNSTAPGSDNVGETL